MTEREAYQEKVLASLKEKTHEIAQLKTKAQKAKKDIQIDFERQIDIMQARLEVTKDKWKHLQNANEDAWEDIKVGVEEARANLEEAVKSAVSRFD